MSLSVSETFDLIHGGNRSGMVTEVVTAKADAGRYRVALVEMGVIDDEDWKRLEAGQTVLKESKGVTMFLRVKIKP